MLTTLGLNLYRVEGTDKDVPQRILQWGTPLHEKGACLMLRDSGSAPSMGVLLRLYDSKLTGVEHHYIRLRGFEPAQEDGQSVGYLQEWAVFPMK